MAGIGLFNKGWIQFFVQNTKKINKSGILTGMNRFIQNDSAYLIKLLPMPLAFEQQQYDALVEAGQSLVRAQTKIIKHLLQHNTKEQLLEYFSLSSGLIDFVDWDELVNNERLLARFDIVPSNDGFLFCEFNFGSNLGASEDFYLFQKYSQVLSMPLADRTTSPYFEITRLLKRTIKQKNLKRIVILILSPHRHLGYVSPELFIRHIKEEMPGIPVKVVDELSYPPELLNQKNGQETCVYRQFLAEDILENQDFFNRLWQSGATIVSGVDSTIRHSKRWFSLFHLAEYQQLLSIKEIALINKYVPYTLDLTDDSLPQIIEQRNDYVFKLNNSLGGKGVYIGHDIGADELRKLIFEQGLNQWTAQRYIEFDGIQLPQSLDRECELHNIVFGLFLIGDSAIGMDVRASKSSKVVNVSSGARSSWAFPMSDKTLDKFGEHLDELV